MIYLRTGANGSGKTLLTLRDVREKQLKESRPVCYNGRFRMIADFGWKQIDAKDWQKEPDGTIFLFDECHNDFPPRKGGDIPDHVKMLAEHRVRGFDFYLITQHPLNFDAFVRRLIGAPGWHQHLKRASGAPLVSVLEWASVNDVCQKAGSGESGSVTMVPYPKEVYKWYESTTLDTAKIKIPFQVKVLIVCLALVPVVAWFGWSAFKKAVPGQALSQPAGTSAPSSFGAPVGGSGGPAVSKKMTRAEYLQSFEARVQGLAYTAVRYDDLAKPVHAPVPAGCWTVGDDCECISQQATKLPMPKTMCLQIVKNGIFREWDEGRQAADGHYKGPVDNAPSSAPVAAKGSG